MANRQDKLLSLLGMAQRAGKLGSGGFAAEQSVKEGGEKQNALVAALRNAEGQASQVDGELQELKNDAAACEGRLRALTEETQQTAEKAQAG